MSRFDGKTFVTFRRAEGLPGAEVNDLLETASGELLLATSGGVAVFRPAAALPIFTPIPAIGNAGGRALSVSVLRHAADGTIWAGTADGLYRLDGVGSDRVLRRVDIGIPHVKAEDTDVGDVLEDGEGGLWVGAASGLFRRWKDGRTARYTAGGEQSLLFTQNLIRDRRGRVWMGTRASGVMRLYADPETGAPVIDLRTADGPNHTRLLPSPWIWQVFEASDGQIWLATAGGLVAMVSDAGGAPRFRAYGPRNGIADPSITAINEDLAGNIWLGTADSGVMRLARDGFRWYGHDEGLETVNSVVDDEAGHVCFRGNVVDAAQSDAPRFHLALGCLEDDRFRSFVPPGLTPLTGGWVQERTLMRARNGEWWIGTGKGLYRFPAVRQLAELRSIPPSAIYTVKEGLAGWQVFGLFEDSRGGIWISFWDAAGNGLDRLDPATGAVTDFTGASGLPSFRDDRPRSFAEDRHGQIWLGFDAGLARYAAGRFTYFRPPDGPAGAIRDMHVDRRGRLWLVYRGAGLVGVDNLDAQRPTFTPLRKADGLSSDAIEVIAEDDDGRLYAGGATGVDQLDPLSGRIRHFTIGGDPGGTMLAAFKDRRGVLWFGMSNGIARLTPSRERPAVAGPVLLTAVRVMGVPQPVSPLGARDLNVGSLSWGQHLIEVDFTGLTFDADDAHYEYRLAGTARTWSALGRQQSVALASLPAGSYQLQIRPAGSHDEASVASLSFAILPPLWRSWWAIALEAGGIVALVLSVHRFRLARAVELADMRTRIALDLHDDVGANLTRIALLSEVAQKVAADATGGAPDGAAPMESIARIARESAGSMSDIVWAINPARDSLLDLVRRMREHADEVFVQRGVQLAFSAAHATMERRMKSEPRRDVLLVFKEAVNNAARHARCSRVAIDIRQEGSRLQLIVADDGVHFDPSADGGGQGLASMRRRAARLRGTLEISRTAGGGTTITLECPL